MNARQTWDMGLFVKTLEWDIIVLRWRAHRCWLLWSVHWCLWNRPWGFYQGKWFFGAWSQITNIQNISSTSIAFKELYPIVVATLLWRHQWGRKRLAFYSDHSAVIHVLNNKYSTSPDTMRLLRRLVLQAAWCNFTFLGSHIRGKTNILSDDLSHLQVGKFRLLAPPGTDTLPCQPPYEVMFN